MGLDPRDVFISKRVLPGSAHLATPSLGERQMATRRSLLLVVALDEESLAFEAERLGAPTYYQKFSTFPAPGKEAMVCGIGLPLRQAKPHGRKTNSCRSVCCAAGGSHPKR